MWSGAYANFYIATATPKENKIEEDKTMRDVLWDYFKPQRDEEVNNAIADNTRANLYGDVRNGTMTMDNAARNAGIPVDQFRQQMEEYNRSWNLQPV